MDNYAKDKVFMLKEEGDTSYVCQIYYEDAAKQDKDSFRDNTYVLHSWIPATRGVLNYWCLANVGLQAVKKLSRESCMYSFNKVNLNPEHRVYFI